MINRCWTTFGTLAEIERDCKERQLCIGDWIYMRKVAILIMADVFYKTTSKSHRNYISKVVTMKLCKQGETLITIAMLNTIYKKSLPISNGFHLEQA